MQHYISRKTFIRQGAAAVAGLWLSRSRINQQDMVMTVNGPVAPSRLGFTLSHEHVMADFIGADKFSKDRYDASEIVTIAMPFLKDIKAKGVTTFIDCTPAYLGRDAAILKRLSDATGLTILTTTGYYGAVHEKFVPAVAYDQTPEQIAAHWIDEWNNGIEGSGIKPGLIKNSTDEGPLTPMQRKLIRAGGLTHLATGLTIAVHSGNGAAAFEQLDLLKELGVAPSARIWVHAQNEHDKTLHIKGAQMGTWVSFDGVNPESLQSHLDYLQNMKAHNLLGQVLVSQDSGWYHVGDPKGGNFKPYTCVLTQFIPLLRQNGFTQDEVDLIFIKNPAKAFTVKVRKL